MEKVKVLLGLFTFLEPELIYPKRHINRSDGWYIHDNTPNKEGLSKVIIHRIDKEVDVLASELDEFCEKSLEKHEGYLIPSLYCGIIQNDL
jgi:hypothetical protein